MNGIKDWQVRTNETANRGLLTVAECGELPFEIRRAFWITDMSHQTIRGGHAHREGHQLLFALTGAARVLATGPGLEKSRHHLSLPGKGIWVPPMHWLDIRIWGANTTLLVFASNPYSEDDYIRDWAEFEKLAQK